MTFHSQIKKNPDFTKSYKTETLLTFSSESFLKGTSRLHHPYLKNNSMNGIEKRLTQNKS